MQSGTYILSLTIWVPIVAGILTLLLNGEHQKTTARWTALIGSTLGLLASIPLWAGFDNATAAMQFREIAPWIARFNINYALGVDGLSMLFILLNSFTTVLVIIAAWEVIQEKVSQYLAAFLIMSGLINGVFAATLWLIPLPVPHPFWVLAFAVVGCGLLGTLGIIAGIWSEKFDQLAAFQNFLVMPLTFLAGVFYSIHSLPAFWQAVSRLNPFFYAIDGFRYGFFGRSDVSPWWSLGIATGAFAALSWLTLNLLRKGYKLRH